MRPNLAMDHPASSLVARGASRFLRREGTPAGSGIHFKIKARGFPDGPQPTPAMPCRVCLWDGNPEWFVQIPWSLNEEERNHGRVWSAEPGCALCALRQRVAERIGEIADLAGIRIGHGRETDRGYLFIGKDPTFQRGLWTYKMFIPQHQAVSADHDAAMATPLRRKLISGNTDSAQSLAFVQMLANKCDKDHPLCARPNPTFRPTRLIGVKPINDARDVALCGPDVALVDRRYIALSYCWGDVIPECRLTTSSLDTMTTRIAWSTIPKTMQDAILYTRRLGVCYLWIDALCILQDDLDDWAQEAAMMAEVYQNSYLTLAALHGEDSNHGLFSTDGSRNYIKLVDLEIEGQVYGIHAFNVREHPYLDSYLHGQGLWPLVRRGWCFQERILAPRVVFFGPSELLWECNTTFACECQEMGHVKGNKAPSKQKLFAQMRKAPRSNRQRDAWRQVVASYSDTKLSMPRDRLIAINGVAKLFSQAEKKGDDYLAGAWSSSLIQDLAWIPGAPPKPCLTIDQLISDPEEEFEDFIAPTWSWASVPGRVAWWRSEREAEEFIDKPLVSIIRYRMEFIGPSPFGLIRSGSIELKAHAVPCTIVDLASSVTTCELEIQGSRIVARVGLDCRPREWDDLVEQYEEVEMVEKGSESKDTVCWRTRTIYLIPWALWGRDDPQEVTYDGVPSYGVGGMLCRSVIDGKMGPAFKRLGYVKIGTHNISEQLQFIYSEENRQTITML